MAITSWANLLSDFYTSGRKNWSVPWYRTVYTSGNSAAGRWHTAFPAAGTGGTGAWGASAGTGVSMYNTTTGAMPFPQLATSGDTRYLLNMRASTSVATLGPSCIMLSDLLINYGACVVTTGAGSTISQPATAPTRLTNNPDGVMLSCIVQTAIGAASPIIDVTYTDSSGTGSLVTRFSFQANSMVAGSMTPSIAVAATLGCPWAYTGAGVKGIQSIQSYSTTSGTTGTVAFVLHRPIAMITVPTLSMPVERDFIAQFPTLPKVDDSACLSLFALTSGTLATGGIIYGAYTFGWG